MPKLSEVRAAAAQAAFWAHFQVKNPLFKSSVPAPMKAEDIASAKLTNSDFESDVVDLIADVLTMAASRHLDPLTVLAVAVNHVPGLTDAHGALWGLINAKAEAAS
jgi:hypothetical protein